jgi:lipoprotein-anchoring transpeptidase ErfK/SrfK
MQAPRRLARLSLGIFVLATTVACQHAVAPSRADPPATPTVAAAVRPLPTASPLPLERAQQATPQPTGRMVVTAAEPTIKVWDSPDGSGSPALEVPTTNPWHQPIRFPVVARSADPSGASWVRVLLGIEPNGSAGWVPLKGLDEARVHGHIDVDMSTHTLRWYRFGRVVREFTVALGAPATPTTPGRFFVWASFPSDFSGAYGAYVLGLSGFSSVLTDWPGGGRMAIHGTTDPADAGHDVSHGCVRVYDPQMLKLSGVPMGTLVRIHP